MSRVSPDAVVKIFGKRMKVRIDGCEYLMDSRTSYGVRCAMASLDIGPEAIFQELRRRFGPSTKRMSDWLDRYANRCSRWRIFVDQKLGALYLTTDAQGSPQLYRFKEGRKTSTAFIRPPHCLELPKVEIMGKALVPEKAVKAAATKVVAAAHPRQFPHMVCLRN